MPHQSLTIALARALTGGSQDEPSIALRLAVTLGRPPARWIARFAHRYVRAFSGNTRPREIEVAQFIVADRSWSARLAPTPTRPRQLVARWPLETPGMVPVPAAADWPVKRIESVGDLAEWLGIDSSMLDWFVDAKNIAHKQPHTKLHHYHYRVLQKRSGGIRIIEAPQERLKIIQRKILKDILEQVPQYYSAAHGFVKGRSVRTFAAPHVQQQAILRIDLQDFFPTIGRARVQALFRTLGYPETVADALGALCTNTTPRRFFAMTPRTAGDVALQVKARHLYGRPHVPQGAPTSPLIANLCAYRLDCRLTGLADWAGAVYTRYADDVAISGSGNFARNVERYAAEVSGIALREGWSVQHHKTRIMRRGVRQHLAGIVVNERLNVSRTDTDRLKAILTNCVRHGPTSQNREHHPDFQSHLRGRVGWVTFVNPLKGQRLATLFEQINWE
ncbi:MAG: RNA-directed DNA polymerase [Phycisphaerae bacterium]|nr:RNA-directed DNA polymerase [Gemmatimonadaceae bacterium]